MDYTYDAQNQLIKRVVDTDGETGTDPIEQTFYLWENGQIALQFDKTGSGDLDYSNLSHRYLWGPEVDQLLVDEVINDVMDSDESDLLWALTDHLNTPRDIVDSDANLLNHITYDSFGNVTGETGSTQTLVGFSGVVYDVVTDLRYHRNRWAEASTNQFLSEDPIKDGWNWRIYVANGPTTSTDPMGLQEEDTTGEEREAGGTPTPQVPWGAYNGNYGYYRGHQGYQNSRPFSWGNNAGGYRWPAHGGYTHMSGWCPPNIPTNPGDAPGPGWEWVGEGEPGDPHGRWEGPRGEKLHPDLNHPLPKGPHWGLELPGGNKYDWYPDGRGWVADPNNDPNRPSLSPMHPSPTPIPIVIPPPKPKHVAGGTMVCIGTWMMTVGGTGTAVLVADDATVVGVADDPLIIATGGMTAIGGVIVWIWGPD